MASELHAARPRLVGAARVAGLSLIEARPPVLLVFGLRFVCGAALAIRWGPAGAHLARLLLAGIGWLAVVWGVYLLNGITDRLEDVANGSRRPIATGRLTTAHAVTIYAGLTAGGLAANAVADLRLAMLALTLALLGIVYSAGPHPAKRVGSVALLIAAVASLFSYVAGAIAASGVMTLPVAAAAMGMSAWILACGNLKDLSDVEGDAAAKRRTVPVRLGFAAAARRTSRQIVVAGAGGLALALVVPAVWPLALLAPAAVVLSVMASKVDPTSLRASRRRPYRAFMWSQYVVTGAILGVALAG